MMDMFPYGSQISTHALREEGDDNAWCRTPAHCHFYPRPPRGGRPRLTTISMPFCKISTHALREEGDELCFCVGNALVTFLPTPSARRATAILQAYGIDPDISTHALREEGDALEAEESRGGEAISTHALREEGDREKLEAYYEYVVFLPTPSPWRATQAAAATQADRLFLPTPSARRATETGTLESRAG